MLNNWLKPIQKEAIAPNLLPYQWGYHLKIYGNDFPNLQGIKAVLIGIGEEEANKVRTHLYTMRSNFETANVADLGNVRNTNNAGIIQLISLLLENQIIPIIIGNKVEDVYAQYQAYQTFNELINVCLVTERFPMTFDKINEKEPNFYLNKILSAKQRLLFHTSVLGYQTHFTDPRIIDFFEEKHFEHIRLGLVKKDIQEIEPVIRDADIFSFDIAALKYAEAPASPTTSPSGMTSEMACQLAFYAGITDKLTSFGIYGFEAALDQNNQTAQVIAQMVWYFVEGFSQRYNDYPKTQDALTEYIVEIKKYNYQLTFWKSRQSGRWWMEVPVNTQVKHKRHCLIPCSYKDYQMASKGEVPDRLMNVHRRFL